MQRDKGKYEKGKQAAEEKLTDKVLEDRECGKSAGCDDDEMNDSDWEDCPIPSRDIAVDAYVDEARDFTIEFDPVPDTKRQKNAYRATAEDKVSLSLRKSLELQHDYFCLFSQVSGS